MHLQIKIRFQILKRRCLVNPHRPTFLHLSPKICLKDLKGICRLVRQRITVYRNIYYNQHYVLSSMCTVERKWSVAVTMHLELNEFLKKEEEEKEEEEKSGVGVRQGRLSRREFPVHHCCLSMMSPRSIMLSHISSFYATCCYTQGQIEHCQGQKFYAGDKAGVVDILAILFRT